MTAAQAIAALDELTSNAYDQEMKMAWLQRVEAGLLPDSNRELSLTLDTQLQAGAPYDELYIRYLQAQVYLEVGEIARYNNAMALYNNALAQFRREYIRENVSPAAHMCHL